MTAPGDKRRFRVAGMLFVTVAINYLDRSNLSIAAPDLSRELALDPVRLGFIFSAFGWTYALCQIPGGWLVDRIRPRFLLAAACGLWSAATFFQGLAKTYIILLGLRLVLGLFEAPAFPLCNKLVTRWFPERERAGAIGFYTSGQFVGLAFLLPLLSLLQRSLGWRSVFFITGAIGLIWAAICFYLYKDPKDTESLGQPARGDFPITDSRVGATASFAVKATPDSSAFRWQDLLYILSQRKLWGLYLGQFALNAVPWFFLTWFPTYLITYRHFDFLKAGLASALPFTAAFVGVISAGLVSDFLVRRGISQTAARKIPIILGMLLSTSIIGADFVSKPAWILFFLTVAFLGNGFASITWVLVSLIAPRRLLGLTGGVFNFFGNLSSVGVPLVIGFIVKHSGFPQALAFVSAIALLGALSYLILVGSVEPVEKPPVARKASTG